MATCTVDYVKKMVESFFSSPAFFILGTEKKPCVGGEYIIYAMELMETRRRVCVRLPRVVPGPHTSFLPQREADLRRRIALADVHLFQPLITFDPSSDNIIQYPYMILGWADGTPLSWSDTSPGDRNLRNNVLRAVANASLDMLRVYQTGESAWDWMTYKIDRKITRAIHNNIPGATLSECEHQKTMRSEFWIPDLDDAPHVLVHGDLSGNNIIVDEQFNVQSIVDLGWAEMVPLQYAAEYPRMITHEPVETERGFYWSRCDSVTMREDRKFYLDCIKERADAEGGICQQYYRVLSRKDEPRRYWWCAAASRIDVHRAMAGCGWDPPI